MKKQYPYFDVLRLLAAFLVVINHTVNEIFINAAPSPTWWGGVVLFFVSKMAVPLFLMMSGALLLAGKESYKTLFTKRILRFVIALTAFSLIIYILNAQRDGGGSVLGFLEGLYGGTISLPYWYLYMLLGILLCLPLLRKLVNVMDTRDRWYFMAVWFVFYAIVPIFTRNGYTAPSPHFTPYLFGEWLGLFMFGYFFVNIGDDFFNKKWLGFAAWAAIVLPISLSAYLTYLTRLDGVTGYDMIVALDRASLFTVAIPSAAVVTLARRYSQKRRYSQSSRVQRVADGSSKLMREVSAATFGVYLIHIIVLRYSRPLFVALAGVIGNLAGMVVYAFCVFAGCLLISLVLRRIPLVKKIL